jgi:hypothetical protein
MPDIVSSTPTTSQKNPIGFSDWGWALVGLAITLLTSPIGVIYIQSWWYHEHVTLGSILMGYAIVLFSPVEVTYSVYEEAILQFRIFPLNAILELLFALLILLIWAFLLALAPLTAFLMRTKCNGPQKLDT